MIAILKFFLCGIFTSLLFPPFFILPLGFIVFPYLFFLLNEENILNKNKSYHFIFGTSFGLGISFVLLYWVKEPFLLSSSTENYAFLSYFLSFYVAIYFGFVFFILSFFKRKFSKLIIMPILFILAEIIREKFLFGFPWVTFAAIASENYYLLQLAFFIGTNGLSLFIVFLFLCPVFLYNFYQNICQG